MIGKLDKEIIEKFIEFQEKTGKHRELYIEDVEFENITIDNIVSQFIKGSTPKYSSEETEYIIIKSGQARGNYNEFNFNKIAYLDTNKVKTIKRLQKGDILINTTGVGTAGRVTLFDLDGNYVTDSHITTLRYDLNKFNKFYLLYFFKDFGFKRLESMAEGSGGQIELSMNLVKQISVPIPKDLNKFYSSYQIQEAIVEFLEYSFDNIERIRQRIDERYSIFERLKKALIPSTFIKDYVKVAFGRYAKEKGIGFSITDVEFIDTNFDYFFDIVTPPKKIKNKEAKSVGKYPVVSQSEGLINGYTDYEEGYIDAETEPIVVFGDHTTIVKYVDFKFFAGADGTKILKTKNRLLPKYAYYQTLNKVKQQGYQRHFQYLKKNNFLIPKDLKNYTSLEIQKIIADFIEYTENRLQKEFDRMDTAYHNLDRLYNTYLGRTFRLIDWGGKS